MRQRGLAALRFSHEVVDSLAPVLENEVAGVEDDVVGGCVPEERVVHERAEDDDVAGEARESVHRRACASTPGIKRVDQSVQGGVGATRPVELNPAHAHEAGVERVAVLAVSGGGGA